MAHTFGNASASATSTATSITSATFTPTSGSTCLALILCCGSATNRAGGAPSFGGVTLTQANTTQKAAASPECSMEIWYRVSADGSTIPAGTATIPNTGAASISYVFATGKAATGKTSAFDRDGGSNNTATNPTVSLSSATTVAGDIIFAGVASGAQTWAPTARTGTQINDTDIGNFGYGSQYLLQASAGAQTMSWTFATSEDYGAVVVAFKEVAIPLTLASFEAITVAEDVTPALTGGPAGAAFVKQRRTKFAGVFGRVFGRVN